MNRKAFAEELRDMLRLAAPLAAAQAGVQLMGVVDTAVVGRLGAAELGAVGLGNTVFFAISILGMGFVMGVDPLASQAFGAGEPLIARRLLWQGSWLAIAVGLFLSVPMCAAPFLLRNMSIDAMVVDEASTYVWLRVLSLVPMLLFIVGRSYLQAKGITRPMIVAMAVGNVFNLIADILLVFGGGVLPPWAGPLRSVPAMGVAGAAIATVAGSILQLAILAASIRNVHVDGFEARHRRPVPAEIRKALAIGFPVGLQWGAEVGVFALVGLLAANLGKEELAAHQIAITLASFTFTVAVGIGSAGSVRVGRAIGAQDRKGVSRAGLVAFVGGAGFMACSALTFLLFPHALSSLLTDQEAVMSVAVPLLAVAAVFQVSDGVQAVGAGVLRGAGDTRFPFLANLVGHWLVGFPIAWLLGFHLGGGIVGLWWGLCAGLSAVAALLFGRFLRLSAVRIERL